MIYMLAAMGSDRTIDKNGSLPWHLQSDIDRYRSIVKGKTVIMGMGDYLSYHDRPLNGARQIVLTSSEDKLKGNAVAASSFEQAMEIAGDEDVYIEGGAGVFASTIKYADVIYLTEIDHAYQGDRFFPEIDPKIWKLTSSEKGYDPNFEYDFYFNKYERRAE